MTCRRLVLNLPISTIRLFLMTRCFLFNVIHTIVGPLSIDLMWVANVVFCVDLCAVNSSWDHHHHFCAYAVWTVQCRIVHNYILPTYCWRDRNRRCIVWVFCDIVNVASGFRNLVCISVAYICCKNQASVLRITEMSDQSPLQFCRCFDRWRLTTVW